MKKLEKNGNGIAPKGEEKKKPLSQFLKKTETRSEGISVPQKLVEANALVKTGEGVTDREVSDLLEKEDSRGNFRIIRDDRYGNPKVVATTHTEKGDKVEFILEISSNKHEKNVSEILEDLEVVSEDTIRKVKLIEKAYRAAVVTSNPRLVEEIIMLVTRSKLNFGRLGSESISHELRTAEQVFYVPARQRVYEAVMRDPNFMSDPADWLKDGSF